MTEILDLLHPTAHFGGTEGGEVIVLNRGAVIAPEAEAMLGALESRSVGGLKHHLRIVAQRGSEKFMAETYVGYGHKSIGDLANTSVFIENVSMLAAKAFQDFPLYNGQESSTRYIDFTHQRFIDPVGTVQSKRILENWRSFYLYGLEYLTASHLQERFPRNDGEDEKTYEKAIKARAFDTMRAFLPGGAATNLVWVGELRQFGDRLPILRHHPLVEIREAARAAERALVKGFPSTFLKKGRFIRYPDSERYYEQCQHYYAYTDFPAQEFSLVRDTIDAELLPHYRKALAARPAKAELPFNIREVGQLRFEYLLDFGSFRDVQRQRAVILPMPLLTSLHGFEPWYLEELPDELREKAEKVLASQQRLIDELRISHELRQYYLPMGYRTANRLTGDLRALVYLVELRATRFVHPTLRRRAVQIAETLDSKFRNDGLVLHLDREPDRFDVKRGTHDIEMGGN